MKVTSLQISNVLSFKHHNDINDAEKIIFDSGLNIIIGENGAGKSTVLEVINFIFKRVLVKQYQLNQDYYSSRSTLTSDQRKQILIPTNNGSYREFRLNPNWDSQQKNQTIRIAVKLDDIDIHNISNLTAQKQSLDKIGNLYSSRSNENVDGYSSEYVIDIVLNAANNTFTTEIQNGSMDFGFQYLIDYNFYKECISLHNLARPD